MRYQIRFVALLYALLFPLPTYTLFPSVPDLARKTLTATVPSEMQDVNGNTLGQRSGFSVRPNLVAPNVQFAKWALRPAKEINRGTTRIHCRRRCFGASRAWAAPDQVVRNQAAQIRIG